MKAWTRFAIVYFRLSIVFLRTRPHFPTRLLAIGTLAAMILCAPACRQAISREQKELRAGLKQAMQEKSYAKATSLAHQILKETPRNNGAWERLVKAQLALGDLAGANQTLAEWRRVVRRDSPKRLERTGDVAMKEGNPAAALEAWSKALAARPQTVRILHKVARADRALHKWSQEDVVLTRALALEDNAANRVLRARCRRQQHRWSEALEDMQRARELAPQDSTVQLNAQLFERLEKFLAPIRELDAQIALTPADDQLLTDRALLFLRSRDPEMALEDAETASKLAICRCGSASRPPGRRRRNNRKHAAVRAIRNRASARRPGWP
jgi:tetratricopeptide (TPR) repeat protein